MSGFTLNGTFAADVANGGNFTVSYPSGTNAGTFAGALRHELAVVGRNLAHFNGFLAAFGASNITITNRSGVAWPATTSWVLSLDTPGERDVRGPDGKEPIFRANSVDIVQVNLGAPIAADADGIAASQSVTVGTTPLAVINGALASGGRVELDVARNVVAAWTNTAVLTVTGLDEYGNTVVESSASGTSFAGKKAFKRVTSCSFSANVTGATIGTGDVLGLPVHLVGAGYVLRELEGATAPTAGTFVAADTAVPSATTGDVRGTYDPNSATNGTLTFSLLIAVPRGDAFRGRTQFAG